jgi:hypothetical protein
LDERFGIPDHSPQHAPDHSMQNPTGSGSFGNIDGGEAPTYSTPTYGGGYTGPSVPYVRQKRSVIAAAILATIFGPLGLFYVNFLSGVAALIVVLNVVRPIVLFALQMSGGYLSSRVNVALVVMWCITIPWAIVGMTIRNARIGRA